MSTDIDTNAVVADTPDVIAAKQVIKDKLWQIANSDEGSDDMNSLVDISVECIDIIGKSLTTALLFGISRGASGSDPISTHMMQDLKNLAAAKQTLMDFKHPTYTQRLCDLVDLPTTKVKNTGTDAATTTQTATA